MKILKASLTLETIQNDAHRLLNIIRYNESGTIIQIQNDCVYRIPQIISNSSLLKKTLGPHYRKYLLGFFPLGEESLFSDLNKTIIDISKKRKIDIKVDEKEDISGLIKQIEKIGFDIGIFIYHTSSLLNNVDGHKALNQLELLLRKHKNLSILFFSEKDLTEKRHYKLFNNSSSLFTHVIKYPLYNEKDSLQFIEYNESMWRISFPTQIKKVLIEQCGGYLWLIRQALRLIRDEKDIALEAVFSHELLTKKLEVIWDKLVDEEKEILRKIENNNLTLDDRGSHQFSYLKSIRLIIEKNGKLSIGIPLLRRIIDKEKVANGLILKDDGLFFNDKDISYLLTKSELRIIQLLIQNKHKIVTKNEIAQKIWGDNWEEKYSDWAIDRLIYRLRDKLKKIGYDESLIKTYKSRGILFG